MSPIKVYGYRWVVLLVYMFINLTMQILWICYAPVTGLAAEHYGATDLQIGFLAMSFMYAYIPLAIPASWAIDTWGFKKSVGLGAVLMGICGLLRGTVYLDDYTATLIFTVGIAIAQPLLLNAGTKLAALWFPLEERATVVGLASVAPFLGIVMGQMVTPHLVDSLGFNTMNLIYGVVGAISAVVFLILARDAPPSPAGHEERVLMLDGLKHVLRLRDFYLLAFIGFVTNAIFNGVSTWVEVIVRPKGLSATRAGMIGGVLLIGGIAGVFVMPPVSDRMHKRKPVYLWGLVCAIPFLVGLALLTSYVPLMITTALLGLFMMGIGPVAAQYATEICYPAPEATSAGLYMLTGQLSVVAVSIMGWSNETHGSFIPSLLVLAGLMVVSAALLAVMKESEMMQVEGKTTR